MHTMPVDSYPPHVCAKRCMNMLLVDRNWFCKIGCGNVLDICLGIRAGSPLFRRRIVNPTDPPLSYPMVKLGWKAGKQF